MVTRAPLLFAMLALAPAQACGVVASTGSEAGIPDIALPPVIDATFPANDSAISEDRRPCFCGTLSGAFTAKLVCDPVYPELDWEISPGYAALEMSATTASVDAGSTPVMGDSALGFRIRTPGRMSPLTETCVTLPPPFPVSHFTAASRFRILERGPLPVRARPRCSTERRSIS
jgi:hypothetical protein